MLSPIPAFAFPERAITALAIANERYPSVVPEPDDQPPLGYRELLIARDRLTTELAQARAAVDRAGPESQDRSTGAGSPRGRDTC